MIGLTDYITKCCWEDVFIAWYIAVDDAYHQLFPPGKRLRRRGPEPDFSDSEVITIGLICDTYFHAMRNSRCPSCGNIISIFSPASWKTVALTVAVENWHWSSRPSAGSSVIRRWTPKTGYASAIARRYLCAPTCVVGSAPRSSGQSTVG